MIDDHHEATKNNFDWKRFMDNVLITIHGKYIPTTKILDHEEWK